MGRIGTLDPGLYAKSQKKMEYVLNRPFHGINISNDASVPELHSDFLCILLCIYMIDATQISIFILLAFDP